ncbi:hypothetical protein INR49_029978 [Caranx melampygus]|nr:hypothetical protein INR49_029978 [Caranx melampygus]
MLSFDLLLQATNKLTDPFIASWQLIIKEREMVNTSSSWVPTIPSLTSTMRNLSASTMTASSTGSAVVHTLQSLWPNF